MYEFSIFRYGYFWAITEQACGHGNRYWCQSGGQSHRSRLGQGVEGLRWVVHVHTEVAQEDGRTWRDEEN